jgi:hypothetical protein
MAEKMVVPSVLLRVVSTAARWAPQKDERTGGKTVAWRDGHTAGGKAAWWAKIGAASTVS